MKIERTTFGEITINGKTYDHDVVVRLSGEVIKRKKKLSKRLYGTSHVLSEDEARFLRKGLRPDHHWLGADGQCAAIPGSRGLFQQERLRSPLETYT
jgi:hypothetical protein